MDKGLQSAWRVDVVYQEVAVATEEGVDVP